MRTTVGRRHVRSISGVTPEDLIELRRNEELKLA